MIQNKQNKVASRGRGKRNNQKRNFGSRAFRDGTPQTIVKYSPTIVGFPNRLIARLRYSDNKIITSTSGVPSVSVFRWNSLFDPDATGVGHQPLYYDTYGAVYDHYAVISAKATIMFINPDTTLSCIVGCVTDDDTSSATAITILMEQSSSKHVLLTPLSGSRSSTTFNMNWSCMEFLGIDPYTSQSYKTAIGSNPSEESDLMAFCATTTAANISVTVNITVEYEVLLSELSTPNSS
jgi:hypothetical protein